jgi:hypothetical protein
LQEPAEDYLIATYVGIEVWLEPRLPRDRSLWIE